MIKKLILAAALTLPLSGYMVPQNFTELSPSGDYSLKHPDSSRYYPPGYVLSSIKSLNFAEFQPISEDRSSLVAVAKDSEENTFMLVFRFEESNPNKTTAVFVHMMPVNPELQTKR